MSSTTTVGPDVATRHVLVVTEPFTGRSQMGFATPTYPKGFVLTVDMLGQTNVFVGHGPSHPNAVLIEHETAQPGDVLPDDEVQAGIAAAKAKQALVPEQRKARAAQAQAAAAAHAAEQAAIPKRLAAIEAHLGIKPAG